MTNHPAQRPSQIVVIGAGFAGYFAARRLSRDLRPFEAEVVLVSDSDHFLYQPMLPEVAVGALDPRSVAIPLATTLPGVHVVRGRTTALDLDRRVVQVAGPGSGLRELHYDRLVLVPGAVTRIFDIPGLAEHAVGFKTIGEALYLRDLLLHRLELANDEPDTAVRARLLRFIVVGAGYAGTELVAQLCRTATWILPAFPRLTEDDLDWKLVDMAPTVMPELGPALGQEAMAVLKRRGVDVRLRTSLTSITDGEAVLTDGTVLPGAVVVWCAGVVASPLIASTGLTTIRGRLMVDTDLRVPGHPEIYAAGDAASVPDLSKPAGLDGKRPLCPPTAQHAMRQGSALARNLVADLRGAPLRDYRHRDLGLVVDLGGHDAVARPLGLSLRGRPAKLLTRGYHLFALPTARRRLRTVLDWILAGRTPDDVSFGLQASRAPLASSEHTT